MNIFPKMLYLLSRLQFANSDIEHCFLVGLDLILKLLSLMIDCRNLYLTYQPLINFLTEMDRFQKILIQVKAKAEKLGLFGTDLVLDHAICAKALDILLNPLTNLPIYEWVDSTCICMAVNNFLFAGLKDLIIEATLI